MPQSKAISDYSALNRRSFCRAGLSLAVLPGIFAGHGLAQDSAKSTTREEKTDGSKGKSKDNEKAELAGRKALILPKEFPKGWHYHPAESGVALQDTWKIGQDAGKKEPYLQCLGKPYGYIRTKEAFEDYEFGLKWRFPEDPNGNSGILLHTNGKDQIWPSSIQIQLHRPKIGHVFASGTAKADNRLTEKVEPRELNAWNECVVKCVNGRISVSINKKKVGELTGCSPAKGMIGLQSEGSEIHFQDLWVRKLSDSADKSRTTTQT